MPATRMAIATACFWYNSLMSIPMVCVICGTAFSVRPYRVKKYNVRFCSRRCLGLARIPAIEAPRLAAIRGKAAHNAAGLMKRCDQCGASFRIPPSRQVTKRYCTQSCYSAAQRVDSPRRYVRITVNGKRVLEHRHVVEQALGRSLERWEQVDHINRDRRDNRLENLRVLSIQEHGRVSSHHRGTPITFLCPCETCQPSEVQ